MFGQALGYRGPFISAVCEEIDCLHFAIVGSEQCTQIRSRHLIDPCLEDSDVPSPAGCVTTGQGQFWAMSSPGKHLLITGTERDAMQGDMDCIITDRAPRMASAAPHGRSNEGLCGHAAGLIGAITGRVGGTVAEIQPLGTVGTRPEHPLERPVSARPKVRALYGLLCRPQARGPY
ncbi:hypothetical protein ACWEQ8_02945 [Streptomyces noursei]